MNMETERWRESRWKTWIKEWRDVGSNRGREREIR